MLTLVEKNKNRTTKIMKFIKEMKKGQYRSSSRSKRLWCHRNQESTHFKIIKILRCFKMVLLDKNRKRLIDLTIESLLVILKEYF